MKQRGWEDRLTLTVNVLVIVAVAAAAFRILSGGGWWARTGPLPEPSLDEPMAHELWALLSEGPRVLDRGNDVIVPGRSPPTLSWAEGTT